MIINNVEVSEEILVQAMQDAGYTVSKTDGKKKPEASYTRWEPNLGKGYLYMDALGRVIHESWCCDSWDAHRLSIGNVAPCTDEGEWYLLKNLVRKKAEVRVLDRVRELSEGKCGEFDPNTHNHRPVYDWERGALSAVYNVSIQDTTCRYYSQVPGVWEKVFKEMEDDVKLMMGVE